MHLWMEEPGRMQANMAAASKEEPQYLIRSDKPEHLATLWGSARKKISEST